MPTHKQGKPAIDQGQMTDTTLDPTQNPLPEFPKRKSALEVYFGVVCVALHHDEAEIDRLARPIVPIGEQVDGRADRPGGLVEGLKNDRDLLLAVEIDVQIEDDLEEGVWIGVGDIERFGELENSLLFAGGGF
jgi:hypothetical protein